VKVLALDLSISATGIARPDGALSTIRTKATGDWRLQDLRDAVGNLIDETGPTLVVFEDLPMGIRNAAAGALGMLHGAIRVAILDYLTLPWLTITPATLKTYATGRGNAPKPDLRMELYKRTGLDVADDNQVDAWWLRALAHDLCGEPLLDLPKTHRRALDKLEAPILTQETR
jgi:Holliday junction resolvasome RuvABC endonuclease subunit